MKRFVGPAAALTLALASVLAPAARAQAPKEAPKEAAKPAYTADVRGSILFQIDQARDKLIALAEAIPAEKYAWRPGEGVRSAGEVFNHVSGSNYFFPTLWGAKTPAGVDPRTFEKQLSGDKAKTVETLKQSFEQARKEIQAVPEADLGRKIKIFGNDATVRDAMLIIATHAHEHLGQAIAYARSNGVVPPWSQ